MKSPTLNQAIRAQAARQEIKLASERRPAEEVRTTYSVAADARRALRVLAASLDCPVNDLVCVAIEDLLTAHGNLPVLRTRTELRERLARTAGLQPHKPTLDT